MMKKKLFAAVGLVLAFAGCGDDVTKTTDVEETVGISQLAKGEEFPNCDSSTAGGMLYAADSGKVFYCLPGDDGYSWAALDGTPGGSVDTVVVKDSLLQTDTLEIPIKGGHDTLVFRDTLLISHLDSLVDLDGKSCAAEMLADSSGYKIVCGGDSVGVVRSGVKGLQGETGATGANGEDGEGCTVADSGIGIVAVQCAADTVLLYKAVCGTAPYEPTKNFCSDGKLYSCSEKPYDPLKDFCYTGGSKDSIVPLCGGKSYDLSTSFCGNDGTEDVVTSLCSGKSYDLSTSFCSDGKLYSCNEKPYDPLKDFCYTGGAKDSIVPLCGGKSYDLSTSFCYDDGIVALCGGKSYDLSTSFCYNDGIVSLCGGKSYDLSTSFCYNDGIVSLCGGKSYDLSTSFCSDGKLYSCNEKPYDPLKDFCYTGGAKDSIVPLCGGKSYDLSTSFCGNDGIVSLCGGKSYDLGESFCYNDRIVSLCGGKSYDLSTSFCGNDGTEDVVTSLCGGKSYDLSTSFCYNDGIVSLCGGKSYDLSKLTCSDSKLYFTDKRNNQTYRAVVIGTQTWMAENLNYEYNKGTAMSYCYDNSADSCAKYGRLYLWSAAMDSAAVFSDNSKGCGDGKTCTTADTVRGVCPAGWHLPTRNEFNTLLAAVGGQDVAGTVLRAASGWKNDGNGSDAYGFSALPAGFRISNGFFLAGNNALFWSASESGAYNAYFLGFRTGSDDANLNSYNKDEAKSVRCLKD